MHVLDTNRLILRRLTLNDAEFIYRLVNDPSWLRFIGDKNVHDLDGARRYLREGPLDMYERFGFGMYRVEERDTGTPAGMCGLIKRDTLPDADVGYAFLPEFRGKGYAYEAAAAVLAYGNRVFGLRKSKHFDAFYADIRAQLASPGSGSLVSMCPHMAATKI